MYTETMSGLPYPEYQAEFYQDVPSKRVISWLIDIVITLALTLLVLVFTFPISLFFLPFWFMTIGFLYRTFTISRWSATLGMRLMAIELRHSDGSRFDLPSALMHTVLFSVASSFVLPQLISLAVAMNTPRKQLLHDLLMGTAAVNRAARS